MAHSIPFRPALAAALLIVGLAPASRAGADSAAVSLPSPQALNALLTSTLRPPRDLLALTARLKLHSTAPIDPYVSHTPTNYVVGSSTNFFVSNDKQNGFVQVAAKLMYKTAHAYFYVQQGFQVDLKAIAHSAAVFEQHSYPTDHALFGQEWTPGVDDDQHITVFNGHLPPSAVGYFSGEDLFPRVVNRYSNQRKMVFMNLGAAKPGTSYYDEVLAHEFQHMIHFSLHPADEAWINEGSSVLAEELNGFGDGGYAAIKNSYPGTQLDAWDPSGSAQYYGGGYLWMLYMYEHYGGSRLTRAELADSNYSNMAVWDDVLAKLGYHQTADEVFADWVVANYLNDRSLAGGKYGYTRTASKASAAATVTAPFTRSGVLPQYATSYIAVGPTNGVPLTLRFSGQPTVPLLNTMVPAQGVWWSNRGDGVDTTLTTPLLDLRSVQHATLSYQVWYDLEKDYDYGYAEVSSDGGKTWYAQRTSLTTNTDPNGANLGNGYTGTSCTAASTPQHCWVQEHVDLSSFAGKKVLVRFEQATDDEYNGQGLAVTHIQVPEIGFDGDNTRDGWQATGWVRTGNAESETWIVQAMLYRPNAAVTVQRMTIGADGRGSLAIPAGTSQVAVAVSPAAPLTTVTNTYVLSGGS